MKARPPLEASCEMPCSIMAAGSGRSASSAPIRILPPAMPRMPEMNDVTRVDSARTEKTRAADMARHSARVAAFSKMTLWRALMSLLHEDRYARRAGLHRHRRPGKLQPRRGIAAHHADRSLAPRAEPGGVPRREARRAHHTVRIAHRYWAGFPAAGAAPAHRSRERAGPDPRERQGAARRRDHRLRADGRRAVPAGHRAPVRGALSRQPATHPRPFVIGCGGRGAAPGGRV